jgi:hypothetical protein
MAMVDHEFVRFLKRSFVQQEIDSLSGCEFANLVLSLYPLFATAEFSKLLPPS